MGASAESVVRDYMAAWRDPKVDELLSFFDRDAIYVPGPLGVHRGVEAIKSELTQTLTALTSATFDLTSVVSDGRTVMVERVDHLSIGGGTYVLDAAAVFEVGADRRILRLREFYDLKSLTDQFEPIVPRPSS